MLTRNKRKTFGIEEPVTQLVDKKRRKKSSVPPIVDESHQPSRITLRPLKPVDYKKLDAELPQSDEETGENEIDRIIKRVSKAVETFGINDHEGAEVDDEYKPEYEKWSMMGSRERAFLKTASPEIVERIKASQMELKKLTEGPPDKCKVLMSTMPIMIKDRILKKLDLVENGDTGEHTQKVKEWVDSVLRIPFGQYRELPIKYNPVIPQSKEIQDYLTKCRKEMDVYIYGQDEIKEVGIDFISKKIRNPRGSGKILVLEGPPGVGKTTFGRHIAKALGKEFGFISLGGATNGCFLDGSQEVWDGSTYGMIVNILMRTMTMDPVIFLDELDKVSGTEHGAEIINVLTAITDPSQNQEFYDKYFWGIPIDISNVTFMFSVNDRTRIPPILRDRLDIRLYKNYSISDRVAISLRHLMPEIIRDMNMKQCEASCDNTKEFNTPELSITNDVIKNLILTRGHDERGLRQLKRNLECLVEKINRMILTNSSIELPINITKEFVYKHIKLEEPAYLSIYS
jgi:ATP-dependent Lon protease